MLIISIFIECSHKSFGFQKKSPTIGSCWYETLKTELYCLLTSKKFGHKNIVCFGFFYGFLFLQEILFLAELFWRKIFQPVPVAKLHSMLQS